ncbi:uncharacterized protein B0H64DRAFT_330237 [Chaetomium fimeti]|uniref:Uncharacterized protein n=1 Tax=Chaetomium fimeti TaxID=1854472 RepID=A0AAE0LN67_9PEZI|nr:hypothetical protein B0H64DRAFT_330237 [Chaetomium fimeti]
MNPPGPNVIPVDDLVDTLASIKKTAFKAVVAVFFTLAILSVLARAGVRLHARRALALDDYVLFTGAILLSGGIGFLYSICNNLYLSSAVRLDPSIISRLDPGRETELIDVVQGYHSFVAIAWTAILLVKLSFLAFFRRQIGTAPGIQRYYWGVVALTTISWVLSLVEPFILCPDPGSGSCRDSDPILRSALTGLTTGLDLLTIILTTFSAVRASRSAAADPLQTAFWLALQASTAVLAAVYYSVWDRVRLWFGVGEGGGDRGRAGEGDVEAGGIQGGRVEMLGMTALRGFMKRVKGHERGVVTEVSQLDTLVGEDDGVRPVKEKAERVRGEVRQVTASPVPRNPPIAYHYPMWGPQSTHGQITTEEEIRAGQDLIWLNPSLQASQTSFGGATLHERRGSERRGSERRGSEPANHIAQLLVVHVAKKEDDIPTVPPSPNLVTTRRMLCPRPALLVELQRRLQEAHAVDQDKAGTGSWVRLPHIRRRLPRGYPVPMPVRAPVPNRSPAHRLVRPEMIVVDGCEPLNHPIGTTGGH